MLLRRIYSALMILLAPAAFAIVLWRGLRDRSYWTNPGERFGLGPLAGSSPSIWLHAVSLGEVSAAAALVRELRARHPTMPFVLTTATPTGRARALALFGNDVDVRFLPYDTPGSVRAIPDENSAASGRHHGDRTVAQSAAGVPAAGRTRGARECAPDAKIGLAIPPSRVAFQRRSGDQHPGRGTEPGGCGTLHRPRRGSRSNPRDRQHQIRRADRGIEHRQGTRAAPAVCRSETDLDRRQHSCRRGGASCWTPTRRYRRRCRTHC